MTQEHVHGCSWCHEGLVLDVPGVGPRCGSCGTAPDSVVEAIMRDTDFARLDAESASIERLLDEFHKKEEQERKSYLERILRNHENTTSQDWTEALASAPTWVVVCVSVSTFVLTLLGLAWIVERIV